MKKKLLFFAFLLTTLFSLNAEIHYTNYGDGWAINANANIAMDIDENGVTDFYINQHPDELGFTPIFIAGCFPSPAEYQLNNIGSYELKVFQAGDQIVMTDANLYDYIEDGRTSVYSVNQGFATGWADLEDQYVGFAVMTNGGGAVINGWIKMSVDAANQSLVIKEMAYHEAAPFNEGAITAGDTGNTTEVNDLDHVLGKVTIAPNPADGHAKVNFGYSGNQQLTVRVQSSIGQEVYQLQNPISVGNAVLRLNTSNWAPGIYFIRFETEEGVHTERLSVSR